MTMIPTRHQTHDSPGNCRMKRTPVSPPLLVLQGVLPYDAATDLPSCPVPHSSMTMRMMKVSRSQPALRRRPQPQRDDRLQVRHWLAPVQRCPSTLNRRRGPAPLCLLRPVPPPHPLPMLPMSFAIAVHQKKLRSLTSSRSCCPRHLTLAMSIATTRLLRWLLLLKSVESLKPAAHIGLRATKSVLEVIVIA